MCNWRSQKGSGKLGCLVFLALAGLFLYGSMKLLPVYIAKVELQDSLDRMVRRAGAEGHSLKSVRKNAERIAELHDFEVLGDSIRAEKKATYSGPNQLEFEGDFFRDVRFPGYTHRIKVTVKASTFVGRL